MAALQLRAEARALLFFAGEYANLDEALAPLRRYASDSGVVDQLGAAGAMRIVYDAFGLTPEGTVVDGDQRFES